MVQQVLRQADSAVALYAPGEAVDLRDAHGRAAGRLTHEASPGSDHQLAFMRALAAFARDPQHVALLQWPARRRGRDRRPADRHRPAVEPVAPAGQAGRGRSRGDRRRADARRHRRRRRHAAACRAAIPTAEAKAAAWDSCLHDRTCPITCWPPPSGASRRRSPGTTAPPRGPVLRIPAGGVALRRTHEIAQEITRGSVPALAGRDGHRGRAPMLCSAADSDSRAAPGDCSPRVATVSCGPCAASSATPKVLPRLEARSALANSGPYPLSAGQTAPGVATTAG